jgi:hypothetical protein
MKINNYLKYTLEREVDLKKNLLDVADTHKDDAAIYYMCIKFSKWCEKHIDDLKVLVEQFGEEENEEHHRIGNPLIKMRSGSIGVLRDLHDLWMMTSEIKLCWTILLQCSKSLRDEKLNKICVFNGGESKRQSEWFLGMIKLGASQILTVPV